MERKGYGTKLYQELFNLNQLDIYQGNKKAATVTLERGLPQGTIGSPFLFNLFLACFSESLEDYIESDFEEYDLSLIIYADEIVLLGQDANRLQIICVYSI